MTRQWISQGREMGGGDGEYLIFGEFGVVHILISFQSGEEVVIPRLNSPCTSASSRFLLYERERPVFVSIESRQGTASIDNQPLRSHSNCCRRHAFASVSVPLGDSKECWFDHASCQRRQ